MPKCERAAGGKCTHYIDRAETGHAIGGRTELIRMLDDAAAGKIGWVFVYKFDRLGRAAETHVIAQQLDDAGVKLISATEGTNQLPRGIQLVVAEDYSRQLAQRTRDGLVKRFEQGGFTGGIAPYGYRVADCDGLRVLEIETTEAEVVRGIFSQYVRESVGFKVIARRLRDRGISARRGKWCFTSIRSVLANPVYTGRIRYNARKMQLNRVTGRRVPRMKDHTEVIERQDEHLRIIDDESFQQVQNRLDKNPGGSHAPRGVAAFTGLVYCECGSRLTRKTSVRKGHTYNYWTCSRAMRYEDCATRSIIREDVLLATIQDRFKHLFDNPEGLIAEALEIATEAAQGNREDADRIKAQLSDIESQQRRRGELLMDRAIPDAAKATIGRQMAEDEQQRTLLLAALDGVREQAGADLEGLAAAIRECFDDARQRLAEIATPEELNRLVEQFVGPIVVKADGSIYPKQMPPVDTRGIVQGSIAGGGFEPPTSGL